MHVAEIWRYPVKSMAGESLARATLSASGIAGDRLVQVYDGRHRLVTARTYPGLLGHRGTLDPAGTPLVDGRLWNDPGVLADVRRIVGPSARLVRDEDPDVRFDVLPLLVATDGAIAAFGRDGRRLRPNIIIAGVPGLEERQWPGTWLRIGDVVIALDSLRGRCVVTTVDPNSLAQDPEILRDIARRFGGRLALNSAVVRGGTIHVGQVVSHAARIAHHKDSPPQSTVSAPTEEQLLDKVAAHAAHDHGVTEVSPDLAAKVRAAIKSDSESL